MSKKNKKPGKSKGKKGKSFAKSAFIASMIDLGIGIGTNILNLLGIALTPKAEKKEDPIYLKPGDYDSVLTIY